MALATTSLSKGAAAIVKLASTVMQSPAVKDEAGEDLLADITGQVTEAFSKSDWYQKWGIHYVPSLRFAHQLQQCNNFKDHGVQHYGGALFLAVRDEADDTFNALPPPKPSLLPE